MYIERDRKKNCSEGIGSRDLEADKSHSQPSVNWDAGKLGCSSERSESQRSQWCIPWSESEGLKTRSVDAQGRRGQMSQRKQREQNCPSSAFLL